MGRAGCCSGGQSSVKLNLLVCWWVELSSLLVGCLAGGDPTLEPTGSLVGLMTDSGRAHINECFSELLLPVSLSHGESQPPPASAGDPPTWAGRSGSVFYGVTAPSAWVLMCTLPCVCPPRFESLFPPVLSKSCNQILLAFKVWFSGNSSSCCWTPGWEAWCGARNLHSSGWTSVVWLFSSLWVTHPVVMGFDFIVIAPSYRLIAASPLSLDVGYLFQRVPVSSCRWLFSI